MTTQLKAYKPEVGQKYQFLVRHPKIENNKYLHLDYAATDAEREEKYQKHATTLQGHQIKVLTLPERYWPAKKHMLAGYSWIVSKHEEGVPAALMVHADNVYEALKVAVEQHGWDLTVIRQVKRHNPVYVEVE